MNADAERQKQLAELLPSLERHLDNPRDRVVGKTDLAGALLNDLDAWLLDTPEGNRLLEDTFKNVSPRDDTD